MSQDKIAEALLVMGVKPNSELMRKIKAEIERGQDLFSHAVALALGLS